MSEMQRYIEQAQLEAEKAEQLAGNGQSVQEAAECCLRAAKLYEQALSLCDVGSEIHKTLILLQKSHLEKYNELKNLILQQSNPSTQQSSAQNSYATRGNQMPSLLEKTETLFYQRYREIYQSFQPLTVGQKMESKQTDGSYSILTNSIADE
ncbi:hypothetical protein MIR68_002741 [Amoeboaphelidium protococcarum]|nr:hypothetical protein MIR68_002741 [Amoeboaphelidium protococcarum]